MKNIISQKQLDSANLAVTRELNTLGLTYNGSWRHRIVFNGVDNKGAWIHDSMEPNEPRRIEWEEIESDLLGSIAARPREEYLTTVIPRISRFDLKIASRFAKQAFAKGAMRVQMNLELKNKNNSTNNDR
jgi:hypothetical protein